VIAKQTDKVFWLSDLETINRAGLWSSVWFRPKGDQMLSLSLGITMRYCKPLPPDHGGRAVVLQLLWSLVQSQAVSPSPPQSAHG